MNLTEIREALAAQLTFGELTTSPRIPQASEVTCPHGFISDMSLQMAAMETVDVDFEITVLVSLNDPDTGWDTISKLCDIDSDESIIDALLADQKLDGTVDSLTFKEMRGLGGAYDLGGTVYMAMQMMFTAHV